MMKNYKSISFYFLLFLSFTLFLGCQSSFKIISVEEWGGTSPTFTLPEHTIERITIHHGGVEFTSDQDAIAYLKHLQNWSREKKGWMDIPYHYLIDLEGNIYQGRDIAYPGDTNTTYDPRGHALVCVLGNYEVQEPNEKQLKALAWLCAKLSLKYQVPLDKIKAHKDYAETLCPGKNLYRYLQDGRLLKMIDQFKRRLGKKEKDER